MGGARPILFLTDYGVEDEYVGLCHAVMAGIAPEARVVDLTHGIPGQDVRRGALTLAAAVPYAPPDPVFLAVVDPGVGTTRRAVVVEAREALLVGPDNGLLSLAWDRLGGPRAAREVTSPRVTLPDVSPTFQGRDVFAPVAAHLATGVPMEEVGPAIDPYSLVRVAFPEPAVEAGRLGCEVIGIDRFGNVQLGARREHLERAGLGEGRELALRGVAVSAVRTFADVPAGAFGLLEDSAGWLAVVRNGGSAAEALHIGPGERLELGAIG
jgi:S-adenosylmethionine hydrolase